MKKKIIAIMILSIFLVGSFGSISALKIQTINTDIISANGDETIFVNVYDRATREPVSSAKVRVVYGVAGRYEEKGRTESNGVCMLVAPFYQGRKICVNIYVKKLGYWQGNYCLYPDGYYEGELSDGGTVTITLELRKVGSSPKIFEKQVQFFPLLVKLLNL
jgi:hypothetical protein